MFIFLMENRTVAFLEERGLEYLRSLPEVQEDLRHPVEFSFQPPAPSLELADQNSLSCKFPARQTLTPPSSAGDCWPSVIPLL